MPVLLGLQFEEALGGRETTPSLHFPNFEYQFDLPSPLKACLHCEQQHTVTKIKPSSISQTNLDHDHKTLSRSIERMCFLQLVLVRFGLLSIITSLPAQPFCHSLIHLSTCIYTPSQSSPSSWKRLSSITCLSQTEIVSQRVPLPVSRKQHHNVGTSTSTT